tara:strand:+ start:5264 stop:6790 length:1527 start_codon:yes stop_codon:yes gene_type:complete
MIEQFILIFSFTLFINWIAYLALGKIFALDRPNLRKIHQKEIPQIGGFVFGLIFLFYLLIIGNIPIWFFIGCFFSILVGIIDDNFGLSWYYKIISQILLLSHLIILNWNKINEIIFFNYSISADPIILSILFTFWFFGIYNSVNLIDGVDGLAGGYCLLICLSFSAMFNNEIFVKLNLFLSIIIVVFLIFNQRPAKFFMGDAGSLFLGYYLAVSPLLYNELSNNNFSYIDITSFVILFSFIIADTLRVFFTRIISGKSPMTADTIHFHHLVLKGSGSYLVTLSMIFLVTLISGIAAVLNVNYEYKAVGMLIQLSFLFLFILTPPAPTYVNIIWKALKPVYYWQKSYLKIDISNVHTLFIFLMQNILFLSIFYTIDMHEILNWDLFISILIISLFCYFNYNDKIIISIIQLFISILTIEYFWSFDFNLITKIITIFLLISLAVFTFQKRFGTIIYEYSALDLLVFFISIGSLYLYKIGYQINFWIALIILSLWFSISFIMRRLFFITQK